MFLAALTFLAGISISIIAIYYSVLGLAAIFAAAVVPIVVMGTVLEVSKLITAWWLKVNWYRAPWSIKTYLTIAVVVLMLITSMGIFGFLSKAHTDQAVPAGDVAAKVQIIDERINNERQIIENARSLIKQLDDAVTGIQNNEGRQIRQADGSTRIENTAERALAVRRGQARERENLTRTIEQAQARITKLQDEKAPFAAELRKVEAEVGPIKYIAKLIYGDNPDANILEKAVTWVIMTIVFVFDPLAVLLLLASQMSFQWAREDKEKARLAAIAKDSETPQDYSDYPEPVDTGYEPGPWPFPLDEAPEIKRTASGDVTSPSLFGLDKKEAVYNDETDQLTPEQTTPEQTTPEQTTPEQTTPEQTTPEQTTPETDNETKSKLFDNLEPPKPLTEEEIEDLKKKARKQ
jgi:hypothetical protein